MLRTLFLGALISSTSITLAACGSDASKPPPLECSVDASCASGDNATAGGGSSNTGGGSGDNSGNGGAGTSSGDGGATSGGSDGAAGDLDASIGLGPTVGGGAG